MGLTLPEWDVFHKLLSEGVPWQEAIKKSGIKPLDVSKQQGKEVKQQFVNEKQQKAIRGK